MKIKNSIILFGMGLLLAVQSCSRQETRGFAIVIDPESYSQAQAEIDQYQKVVEGRGLKPILVIDRWGVPDSIRQTLKNLYNAKKNPIEGCVFIGDIPVAKVRDAQFLSSAFKMDQDGRFPMSEYCISTDRFYDSFDLEWDFLERDQERTEYFYYSLRTDCSQQLRPSIYSARIFPRTNERGNKYEKLRAYMKRVNEADANNNPIDNVLYFGGHGNISESADARIDEKIEFYDQLPWLKSMPRAITFIDFRRDEVIKERLITELQNPQLDYALLHHHGSEEEQLLSGSPLSASLTTQYANARRYAHSIAHTYKKRGYTMKEAKAAVESYLKAPIPSEWIDEAFNPEIEADDDAVSYAEDLHVAEFGKGSYLPQVRMVSLDACYNGSFHVDESIQECYLFTPGSQTLIAIANSVNSIQNRWINRYLGCASLGMRVGYFAVLNNTLESHLFGDPTFAFTPAATLSFGINDALVDYNPSFWKKQLDSEYPAIQALATYMLAERCEGNYSDLIYNKFLSSESGMVRLAALFELATYADDNYTNCLARGINDNFEMVMRFAVELAAENGDERLIEPLVRLFCTNTLPERVEFCLTSTFHSFPTDKTLETFERVFPEYTMYNDMDKVHDSKARKLKSGTEYLISDFYDCSINPEASEKNRVSEIRGLRNYPSHVIVPDMLDYLKDPKEVKIQTVMWEVLGWYVNSYMRPQIAKAALSASQDERFDLTVRKEAERTYNRLK